MKLFICVSILFFGLLSWPALAGDYTSQKPLNIFSSQITSTTYTHYAPIILVGKPTNSMAQATLDIDDLSEGWTLFQSSVITNLSRFEIQPVEGYQKFFQNFRQLYTGPSVIINTAILFADDNEAHRYLIYVENNIIRSGSYTKLRTPHFGGETIAYQSIIDRSSVMNLIVFRKRNISILIIAGGRYPVAADPSFVISLAYKLL